MFALGIDPGLSRCGYGAVRAAGGSLVAEAYGHLSTPPSHPLAERLGVLLGDLEALVAELRPDAVVVERVLFQVNARTAMSVGQASGLALAAAARAGCPVVEYSPNEVKLAVTGDGSAGKAQVQRMVATLLGLPAVVGPPDRADALALAVCHLSGARLRQAASVASVASGASVAAVVGRSGR